MRASCSSVLDSDAARFHVQIATVKSIAERAGTYSMAERVAQGLGGRPGGLRSEMGIASRRQQTRPAQTGG
jgi:hypothetical protein